MSADPHSGDDGAREPAPGKPGRSVTCATCYTVFRGGSAAENAARAKACHESHEPG